jgi:uncharacterized protein (DUF1501 family)
VESGQRRVVIDMFSSVPGPTWDTHGWGPFATMADLRDRVAPAFDRGYTTLLDGLASRGLLESTLVVAMGEFGRTPRINPDGGRDHWTRCYTAILAGAGVRGGEVYGASDAIGAEPRDNPVTRGNLMALCNSVI